LELRLRVQELAQAQVLARLAELRAQAQVQALARELAQALAPQE
jgi:hypothetical protein